MRKTVIKSLTKFAQCSDLDYLDLETLAQVEISSENPEFPIESALIPGSDLGWKAATSGAQTIRLVFDQPQIIKHIALIFDEPNQSRTQEFVLLWRRENEDFFQELLRQQFHFSPPQTSRQVEDYAVDLKQLNALELQIIPDISRGNDIFAVLSSLRLSAVE